MVELSGWRKSSYSGVQADCVEVGAGDGVVAVRDSKAPDGPALVVSRSRWLDFLAALRSSRR